MSFNRFKRGMASGLTLFLLLCLSVPAAADSFSGHLSARSAVLIEATSGRVLYARNAGERLPMASTTKIMTGLVAIESGDLEAGVKISRNAAYTEGSSLYLQPGEFWSRRELIEGLLLESGNDAAVALAEGVAGSVGDFVDLMNRRAKTLGLDETSFKNPHGLPEEGHYSTARDLAELARHALLNPTFATTVRTREIPAPGGRLLVNHNKLLGDYPGAVGVKMGYTRDSGRCLVAAATRDDMTLIAVVLDAPDHYRDVKSLLDYGFETYRLVEAELKTEPSVDFGKAGTVRAALEGPVRVPLGKGETLLVRGEVLGGLVLPVYEGQRVGTVTVTAGDWTGEYPLVARETLRAPGILERLLKSLFGG